VYAWKGNSKVGEGRMEILESSPSRIVIKLDFVAPFEAHNTAEFTLTPAAGETVVNWSMHGPTPFVGKIMHVFMNMDRMVGKDFETGLANIKAQAEAM
ncbi:MAG: SRPBCC family protein, partial [Dokdonella sp.]|uniref:SRPBCC family protein n=1 Tax=Dokdonella sp. TaxID=2291710 RepID=UPI003267A6C6